MEENKQKILDLTKILPLLLRHWRLYAVGTAAVALFVLVFIFTIPRYYTCKIMLAPESTEGGGALSSLMSSFGLGSMDKSDDAISPMLYPDLMESRDFIVSLFPIQITTKDGRITTSYYDYLLHHCPGAWYMNLMAMLKESLAGKEKTAGNQADDSKYPAFFMLTTEQDEIAQAIGGKIKYHYDKKTGVVSVAVTDLDPLVCAMIADTVSHRLQDFIMDYRTKKARNDLEYSEKLYAATKAEYEEAYAAYAAAIDANWDLVNETVKAQVTKLENDKNIKYQAFSTVNQKLQMAKAKLQEDTPVITEVQKASVPVKPAGPKRMFITLGLLVLVYMGITMYVVGRSGLLYDKA